MKSLFSTGDVVSTCMLPLEYSFQKSFLGVSYEKHTRNPLDYDRDARTPHDFTGFVKRWANYLILDDLTIKAVNSTSVARFLLDLKGGFKVEKHAVNISKTQVCH